MGTMATTTATSIADLAEQKSAEMTMATARSSISTSSSIVTTTNETENETESKTSDDKENEKNDGNNENSSDEKKKTKRVTFGHVEVKLCLNYKTALTRDQRESYWYGKGDFGVFSERYQRDIIHEKEKLAAKKKQEQRKAHAKDSMAAFARSFGIGGGNNNNEDNNHINSNNNGDDHDHGDNNKREHALDSMAAFARSFGMKKQPGKASKSSSTGSSPIRTLFGRRTANKAREGGAAAEFVFPPEIVSKKAVKELEMFLRDHKGGDITADVLNSQRFMKVNLTQNDMRKARVLLANYYGGRGGGDSSSNNNTSNEKQQLTTTTKTENRNDKATSPAPIPYYFEL